MQTTNWDYEGMLVLKVKVISLQYIFQVLYVLFFTRPRYQVSVYWTIGPLVFQFNDMLFKNYDCITLDVIHKTSMISLKFIISHFKGIHYDYAFF